MSLISCALEALAVQPRISPWVFYSERTQQPYKDIRKPWETARRKAGCSHLLIKDLRTAFANRLEADYGVPANDIALLMGHFDKSTTQKHYLEDRTAEKVAGLLRKIEKKKG